MIGGKPCVVEEDVVENTLARWTKDVGRWVFGTVRPPYNKVGSRVKHYSWSVCCDAREAQLCGRADQKMAVVGGLIFGSIKISRTKNHSVVVILKRRQLQLVATDVADVPNVNGGACSQCSSR